MPNGEDWVVKTEDPGSKAEYDRDKGEVKCTSERTDGAKPTGASIEVRFEQKFAWKPISPFVNQTPERFFHVDMTTAAVLTANPFRDMQSPAPEDTRPGKATAEGLEASANNEIQTGLVVNVERKVNNLGVDSSPNGQLYIEMTISFNQQAKSLANSIASQTVGGGPGDGLGGGSGDGDESPTSTGVQIFVNKACKAVARVWTSFSDLRNGLPPQP